MGPLTARLSREAPRGATWLGIGPRRLDCGSQTPITSCVLALALVASACTQTSHTDLPPSGDGLLTTTVTLGDPEPPVSTGMATATINRQDDETVHEEPIAFDDVRSVGAGDIVVAGETGASVYDRESGETRSLTDRPLASLLVGDWGIVYQQADGTGGDTSTSRVWWLPDDRDEQVVVFGDEELVESELYEVIEVGGKWMAVIRLVAFQNDDLWILQPLDGEPALQIGYLSGGEADVPCIAFDGTHLYVAANAHDSQIGKVSLDGAWSAFLPGGRDDVWAMARTCVARAPSGGFIVSWQPGSEDGSPPAAKILHASDSGEIDHTLELRSDIKGALRVDIDEVGLLLITDLEGSHWLVHREGSHPSPIPITGGTARFAR